MALMSFFKRPQHQRFEYNPKYYNPKQEDLEARLRIARNAREGDADAIKSRISSGFKKRYAKQKGSTGSKLLRTNMLLISIIVILFGMTYVFLTIYLPEIVRLVE